MRNPTVYSGPQSGLQGGFGRVLNTGMNMPRQFVIGIILVLALFAFEMFNFDTTRYALESLLGEVTFMGIGWATILAIAFCSIDFAGLARLFTPEQGRNEPKEVWYLTGAWLLGATMNAVMTWWAVSLTLLNHDLGNEVLSREQLLKIVPVFVAILVWLTRILFIGAVTIAGERLLDSRRQAKGTGGHVPQPVPVRAYPAAKNSSTVNGRPVNADGRNRSASSSGRPEPVDLASPPPPPVNGRPNSSRVRHRPQRPASGRGTTGTGR